MIGMVVCTCPSTVHFYTQWKTVSSNWKIDGTVLGQVQTTMPIMK
jgi:hypothetical protein